MNQPTLEKTPVTLAGRDLNQFTCCVSHLSELQSRAQVVRITADTRNLFQASDVPCAGGPVTKQNLADVVAWAAS